MITANEAKRFMEEANIATVAVLRKHSEEWIQANIANQIIKAAKKGNSFVTVSTRSVLPSMKKYINDILGEGGYKCEWHQLQFITIRWN